MPVDQEFISQLKSKLSIVDVVQAYVPLERRGGNWWGCCPFHREKTPSFSVSETGGFYHCFGCHESGDMIKFVSQMESIEFYDSVKILAEKAKLPMPKDRYDDEKTLEKKKKKDALLSILHDSALFYVDNLNSGKADLHLNYTLKRGIDSKIIRAFGLGASLNFSDLPEYLLDKGYKREDILDSGAVVETNGSLFDAQGGRLIFPIINSFDEVIAFGGRSVNGKDVAKYKNTRDTAVFSKGKTLYNVNLLKKYKKSHPVQDVIMVEGYMDAISLYQAGFKNVVASMGTSLTRDQASLCKRYSLNVLSSYDGDAAGQKATIRGLEIFKSEGLNVKVVRLPPGKDPDEVIKHSGAGAYQKCLNEAIPLIDYKLSILEDIYNLQDTEQRRQYIKEALKVAKTAENASEAEDLLKHIHDVSGTSYESLSRDLGNVETAPNVSPPKKTADKDTKEMKASRHIVASYLFEAKYAEGDPRGYPYVCDTHHLIADYVYGRQLTGEMIIQSDIFGFVEDGSPEYEEFTKVLDLNDDMQLKGEVGEKYFKDSVKTLKIHKLDEDMALYLQMANEEPDIKNKLKFLGEYSRLTKEKSKLAQGGQ